jgi:hypothetical protein
MHKNKLHPAAANLQLKKKEKRKKRKKEEGRKLRPMVRSQTHSRPGSSQPPRPTVRSRRPWVYETYGLIFLSVGLIFSLVFRMIKSQK